ncbi:MAG: hypothetical protein HY863_13395 [Chloroflexi bacterium]|nr:hypothetical protein [Chloroflexota bacterium]
MKTFWISLALLLSLTLESCGPSQSVLSTPLPVSPTEGDSTQMTPPQPTPANPAMQNLIDKATQDLAQKLAVSANQINLVAASEVVWPDGSLGCPQKGMEYIQVLTPGYLIILENNNHRYEYHSGRDGNLVYCPNPTPPTIGTPGDV